jgi:hypothetical protein
VCAIRCATMSKICFVRLEQALHESASEGGESEVLERPSGSLAKGLGHRESGCRSGKAG